MSRKRSYTPPAGAVGVMGAVGAVGAAGAARAQTPPRRRAPLPLPAPAYTSATLSTTVKDKIAASLGTYYLLFMCKFRLKYLCSVHSIVSVVRQSIS